MKHIAIRLLQSVSIYALLLSASHAQTIAPGHAIGNGKASTAAPTDTALTAIIDQMACATNNDFLQRTSTVWNCSSFVQGTGMTLTQGTGTLTIALSTPVALSNGGTNANITANNGAAVVSTGSALALVNYPGSAGQCLLSGQPPTWGSCAGGSTGVGSLGNASADTTLTITGTGSGPWTGTVTVALNLSNANTWTATQSFVVNGGVSSNIVIDTPGASQAGTIAFKTHGGNKWLLQNDANSNFELYDFVGSRYDIVANINGNLNLMPTASSVTIGTTANLATPAGGLAVAGPAYFANGKPWVDVMAGGNGCAAAANNDSTDDTSAIQCQVNYMVSTYGGGVVFFPCGSGYKVSSEITVGGPVRLVGEGIACSILDGTGSDFEMIKFYNSSTQQHYGGWENLTFDCYQNSAAANYCVEVDNFVDLLGFNFKIWGGDSALALIGTGAGASGGGDNTFMKGFISAWGTNGADIYSYNTGNWFYDIKADTTGQTTGYAFYTNTDTGAGGVAESSFFRIDMSGNYSSGSLYVNDASAGRSVLIFNHAIIGGSGGFGTLDTFRYISFVGSELGTGTVSLGSGGDQLSVVGSTAGNGSGSLTFSGGTRSCAGNIGISC